MNSGIRLRDSLDPCYCIPNPWKKKKFLAVKRLFQNLLYMPFNVYPSQPALEHIYAPVAQLAERHFSKVDVGSSSLSGSRENAVFFLSLRRSQLSWYALFLQLLNHPKPVYMCLHLLHDIWSSSLSGSIEHVVSFCLPGCFFLPHACFDVALFLLLSTKRSSKTGLSVSSSPHGKTAKKRRVWQKVAWDDKTAKSDHHHTEKIPDNLYHSATSKFMYHVSVPQFSKS